MTTAQLGTVIGNFNNTVSTISSSLDTLRQDLPQFIHQSVTSAMSTRTPGPNYRPYMAYSPPAFHPLHPSRLPPPPTVPVRSPAIPAPPASSFISRAQAGPLTSDTTPQSGSLSGPAPAWLFIPTHNRTSTSDQSRVWRVVVDEWEKGLPNSVPPIPPLKDWPETWYKKKHTGKDTFATQRGLRERVAKAFYE